jgi:DNA-binding MarR family transcriptional regulator
LARTSRNAIKTLQRVTITLKQVNMTDIKRARSQAASGGAAVVAGVVAGVMAGGTADGLGSDGLRAGGPSDSSADQLSSRVAIVELLFFAYRDFTAAADKVLSGYGLGRAHHRVLHFVHRNPGLRVADLLDLLRITKQSLARVLKQLVDEGWITQQATVDDRRVRRLYVTAQGRHLADRLIAIQTARVAASIGPDDGGHVRKFLSAMVASENASHVAALIQGDAAAVFAGRGSELASTQTATSLPDLQHAGSKQAASQQTDATQLDAKAPPSKPATITG